MKQTFVEGLPLKFKPTKWILAKYEKINVFNQMSIKELHGYCIANNICATKDNSGRSTRGDVTFSDDKKGWRINY